MTDCFPSPPSFNRFGNKRLSSAVCYEEMSSDLSQSKNQFKRQRNDSSMSYEEKNIPFGGAQIDQQPFGKRARFPQNIEEEEPLNNGFSNGFPSFQLNRDQGCSSSGSHLTESYRAELRMEFQRSLDEKDANMLRMRSAAQSLEVALSQSQGARVVCEEENKLLKRAVAIQDSRQKELTGQTQQLQHVLGQAAEHIANLERVNRELRLKLESNSGQYSSNFSYRPPDVF